MIDIILLSFFLGTAYISFRAGAKYQSFNVMFDSLMKEIKQAVSDKPT